MDFLTFEVKKVFINQQKAFTKALIFYYFDLKYYIWIQTDTSRYVISEVLSQITLKQYLSNHIIYE